MNDQGPTTARLRNLRLLLWLLVALAGVGAAALTIVLTDKANVPKESSGPIATGFGGPFTLTGADGKPFSSQALLGKPYAIYFGFTRCGGVCPMTLSRLVKLRREAANDSAIRILFVTIDPAHDGPREVGQYASLFNAPIIGLTGSQSQIQDVKKRYGIYAQPVANAPMGKEMEHSAIVLLFDASGHFTGTISPDEPDEDALAKMRKLAV